MFSPKYANSGRMEVVEMERGRGGEREVREEGRGGEEGYFSQYVNLLYFQNNFNQICRLDV